MKTLTQQGYSFSAIAERVIVRVVMETVCYMRLDYDTELKSTAEIDTKKTNILSDGNIITVAPNVPLRECIFPAKCQWQRSQWNPQTLLFSTS